MSMQLSCAYFTAISKPSGSMASFCKHNIAARFSTDGYTPAAAASSTATARLQVSCGGGRMQSHSSLCSHEEVVATYCGLQKSTVSCPSLRELKIRAFSLPSVQGRELQCVRPREGCDHQGSPTASFRPGTISKKSERVEMVPHFCSLYLTIPCLVHASLSFFQARYSEADEILRKAIKKYQTIPGWNRADPCRSLLDRGRFLEPQVRSDW